jgi:FkbM family methyltransferase
MPLRNEQLWLDWDNALSVTAHDPDVKETYQNLLDTTPLKHFFDVGANYGTHSLLLLSQGVHTTSFEPNSSLNGNFELLCELNNTKGKMENYAVGDRQGVVQLHFPADATWLGTIVEGEATFLKTAHQLTSMDVRLITLDQYAAEKGMEPDLIKIDTEGNELNVLIGAKDLLVRKKPLVIFESNTRKERQAIWGFLAEIDYIICDLPFGKGEKKAIPASDAFINSPKFNFIAIPKVA